MNMDYFNAEKTRDNLVNWIKDWFGRNGKDKYAVIGISGGTDSTVVAALCTRALGKERVLGVLMPNGVQKDIGDSIAVCNSLGIKHVTVNINDGYRGLASNVIDGLADGNGYVQLSDQTLINLAPRLRMATLYAVGQTVGGRVVNTSNLSEATIGYFTRWGDECGDLKPLINLTKNEVVAIGLEMPEIPRYLVEKTPSDGLTGTSDENRIGFSYDVLDRFIRDQKTGLPDADDIVKIRKRLDEVGFKRKPVDQFNDIAFNDARGGN